MPSCPYEVGKYHTTRPPPSVIFPNKSILFMKFSYFLKSFTDTLMQDSKSLLELLDQLLKQPHPIVSCIKLTEEPTNKLVSRDASLVETVSRMLGNTNFLKINPYFENPAQNFQYFCRVARFEVHQFAIHIG